MQKSMPPNCPSRTASRLVFFTVTIQHWLSEGLVAAQVLSSECGPVYPGVGPPVAEDPACQELVRVSGGAFARTAVRQQQYVLTPESDIA
jgi:hypothetical protein